MRLSLDTTLTKRITSLAVPVILAMLSQTFINVLDTIMVGRLPGATGIDGVAAIGVSLPIYWAVGGFLSAVAIGTQALTARRTGEGKPLLAGRALTNSLAIASTSSITVSIVGFLVIPHVFHFLNSHPNVVRLGSDYLSIRMLGVFSMVTTISYKGFFDGIGKTHIHMVASIAMNVVNFVLNFLLIFGLWGFPRLEVLGAAYASLISTYVGLGIMILYSMKSDYRKTYRYYRFDNLSWSVAYEIIRLLVPSGLATVFVMSGFEFFFWAVGNIDKGIDYLNALGFLPLVGPLLQGIELTRPDLATSATQVIIAFLMLVFMTSIAFGTATATLVGQSMGAKDYELAERYGWESVKMGMYFFGILGIVVAIWPHFFLAWFIDKPEVIEVAASSMRLMGSVASLISAGLILIQALFGAGATKFVMVVELCLHSLCLIPLSYLLAVTLELGVLGAWFAAAAYVVLLSSIMAWKFYGGTWKEIRI